MAPSVHPSSVSPVVSKDNADAQLINVTDAVENMVTQARIFSLVVNNVVCLCLFSSHRHTKKS